MAERILRSAARAVGGVAEKYAWTCFRGVADVFAILSLPVWIGLPPKRQGTSYGKLYATYASLDFDPNLPPPAATTTNCLPATANVLGVA